jgi:hypothetical protein
MPSQEWKQAARSQPPVAIDMHKMYTPAEVASILNVSYDTAISRMEKMHGCVNMGPTERRYKRGKRMLRVSGKRLRIYLEGKQI